MRYSEILKFAYDVEIIDVGILFMCVRIKINFLFRIQMEITACSNYDQLQTTLLNNF